MRTKLTVLSMVLFAAGCGGGVTAETQADGDAPARTSPPSLQLPTPVLVATPAISSDAGAPQDPYGPPGQAGCSFGVSGAVNAWIGESPTSWAWVWPYFINCSGEVDGIKHGVSFEIGSFQGPGSYPASAQYTRLICTSGVQDCTYVSFDGPTNDAACAVELTSAPAGSLPYGATIAGTFSCSGLADAKDPSSVVSLYAGSFWGPLLPPPD